MARSSARGALLIVLVAVLASVSCAFDLPQGVCDASLVDLRSTGAATQPSECTTCLESSCCDEVGRCDEGCQTRVKEAQACIERDGFGAEVACTAPLLDQDRKVYACMRGSCGRACGVPSCTIDPAAPLVGTPQCDLCITSSCCEEINSCYENRRCKLIIDCILDECALELGQELVTFGKLPREAIEQAARAACGREEGAGDAPGCIGRCLAKFESGDREASCRAFGIYACAAKFDCGRACVASPDAAAD